LLEGEHCRAQALAQLLDGDTVDPVGLLVVLLVVGLIAKKSHSFKSR